jgi:hypothetical protein
VVDPPLASLSACQALGALPHPRVPGRRARRAEHLHARRVISGNQRQSAYQGGLRAYSASSSRCLAIRRRSAIRWHSPDEGGNQPDEGGNQWSSGDPAAFRDPMALA